MSHCIIRYLGEAQEYARPTRGQQASRKGLAGEHERDQPGEALHEGHGEHDNAPAYHDERNCGKVTSCSCTTQDVNVLHREGLSSFIAMLLGR